MSWVLGVNSPPGGWHDSAACLVDGDGRIAAFCEEERLSRSKHAFHAHPANAVTYCLKEAGISAGDVGTVAFGWDIPHLLGLLDEPFGGDEKKELLLRCFGEIPSGWSPELVFVNHHLAHAACAFYASGYAEAGVVVVDGNGEDQSTTIYSCAGGRAPTLLAQWPLPASLGFMYEAASTALGMPFYQAGKTMGLAAYGYRAGVEPWPMLDFSAEPFATFFSLPDGTRYAEVIEQGWGKLFMNYASLPVATPSPGLDADPVAVKIAFSAQVALEQAMARLVAQCRRETGIDAVCIGGGVALNCSSNGKLEGPVYVPPVPYDAGNALGAAWHVAPPTGQRAPLDPYLGEMLRSDGVSFEGFVSREADPGDVAERLAAGQVGAIAQGRSEIGPRALCHRSIIADVTDRSMLDRVNVIKGRELWRPLSPVALESTYGSYWERSDNLHRYMLGAAQVHDAVRDAVPAVVHVDGTARVQCAGDSTGFVYDVLCSLERAGRPPVLINTSFNGRGEPIVSSGADVVDAARRLGLDFLVFDDTLFVPVSSGS